MSNIKYKFVTLQGSIFIDITKATKFRAVYDDKSIKNGAIPTIFIDEIKYTFKQNDYHNALKILNNTHSLV